jgi:hypothetical protein
VWDFESVDTADVADESGLFEMEPMNELRVGHDVHLKSILKSTDAENEITVWYAQVGGLDIVILARITTLPSNPPPHPTLSLSFD